MATNVTGIGQERYALHAVIERFAGRAVQLRGRSGLTQREMATRLGVHVHSVQLWEAAASHPNAQRLKALLEVLLERGAFASGQEVEEAEALWSAAMDESPRLTTPFDRAGFLRLLQRRTTRPQGRQSWGNAPDVERFLSRTAERATLQHWIVDEGCRVVAVLGLGGIGKTQLATRLAHDLEDRFQNVYWRSLQNAPRFSDWLVGAIGVLSPNDPLVSAGDAQRLDRLLELLREAPSLLVIDNLETILQPGDRTGEYLPGYAAYGELLRLLAQTPHQSCVVLTSREEPPELSPLKGSDTPVRTLTLGGLGPAEVQQLLHDKSLQGDATQWANLVERYGGNGLALRVVGETIRELFGGDIAEFLGDVAGPHGGVVSGVRNLLDTHMGRLSQLEKRVLRRMAVEREPVTFAELAAGIGAVGGRGPVREATAALLRRALVERREAGPTFLLQPVILEYITDQLTDDISREIIDGGSAELREQPLLKATAKDFVRRSQERLILQPILEHLLVRLGSQTAVERRLVELLSEYRNLGDREQQAYGPGNVINLLRLLRGDLQRIDISGLLLRQAYLQGLNAQDADLARAHIVESTLPEAFDSMSVWLSTDGAHLLTGTTTGTVALRRASDRALLLSMRGHAGAVWRVRLSPDERVLASASEDGTAHVWEASSGKPIATLKGHTDFVQGIAFSNDGTLATASQDGTVKLWRPVTDDGELLRTFESPDGGVLSVDISPDGTLVMAGTRAGTIAFWDAATGRLVDTMAAHTAAIPGLALSRDTRMLASASLDGKARLWEVRERRLLTELSGHTGGIWDISLARGGRVAATAGQDGTVRLWSTDDGHLLNTLACHDDAVWSVSLSGDGTRVASAGQDGSVRLSDGETGALLMTMQGHTTAFRDVALSADGRVVASGTQGGTVMVWDNPSGKLRTAFDGHTAIINGVAVSDDGSIVVSASQDGTLKVWDVDAGRLRCTLDGHTGTVWDVALTGDGHRAVSSSYDGTVRFWDTWRGAELMTLRGHSQGVRGVALNGARGLVVSGSQDGALIIWDAQDGHIQMTLRGHSTSVQSVAMDAGGNIIASAGFDGVVKLWDVASGACLRTLAAHSGGVLCVALSDDGHLLVTGGFDRTVKLWDANTGGLLKTLTGHAGAVWGVALSAASSLLASASFDGTIKLWDLPAGTSRRTLQPDRPFERVNIGGLTGVTPAQRAELIALGAVDEAFEAVAAHTAIDTLE